MDHNYLLQLSRQKNKSIKTRREPANGYEADLENSEKFYPPAPPHRPNPKPEQPTGKKALKSALPGNRHPDPPPRLESGIKRI